MCVFFFFKQKTAYEMRISDWSSDVCSSDLFPRSQQIEIKEVILRNDLLAARVIANHEFDRVRSLIQRKVSKIISAAIEIELLENETVYRSEEHTSELQSLMRISYAVFCLKKKIQLSIQEKHKRR